MKKYEVRSYYTICETKTVEAETEAQAEEIAFDSETGWIREDDEPYGVDVYELDESR
jgi:hypothetical protein